ncbi:MAG: acetolactate synthase small subunit [Nitrospinota bacterium]
MRHIISVLVENKFGVLSRISGLFSGRGYNIESLSVAETVDSAISRMTIITKGNDRVIEQITKHLNKLIDVIKVIDHAEEKYVSRELALLKINSEPSNRDEILRIVQIFRGKIIDMSPKTYTVEVTGTEEKIDAFIEMVKPLGIKEIARTGVVAMSRGSKSLT